MKYLILLIAAVIVVSVLVWRFSNPNRIVKIPEASGIDYCPDSGRLIVVNDEGWYYEIDTEGRILHQNRVGEYDLEGVVCLQDKLIFVVENEGLLLFDKQSGATEKIVIDTNFQRKTVTLIDKKSGIEGIAAKGDLLYLAKQTKKSENSFIAVAKLEGNTAKIVDLIDLKLSDLAGLTIHNDLLYIVSDQNDRLVVYDLAKKSLLQELKLPKSAQEGIAFDSKGLLYIADDDGYILRYSQKELGLNIP